MTLAKQHAAQLQGTVARVALLSVQPLPRAKAIEKLHFVLLKGRPGERVTQQVVEGFLNNFGDQLVKPLQPVEQLRVKASEPTTIVVAVTAEQKTMTSDERHQLSTCTTIQSLKSALATKAPNLVYEDLFKLARLLSQDPKASTHSVVVSRGNTMHLRTAWRSDGAIQSALGQKCE